MPSADSCAAIRSPCGSLSSKSWNMTQASLGKLDRLPRTPAGSTARVVDGHGLRDWSLARPARDASYPVSVRQVAVLLHTSFRHRLAVMPLWFAKPSPPSSWPGDFPPPKLSNLPGTRLNRFAVILWLTCSFSIIMGSVGGNRSPLPLVRQLNRETMRWRHVALSSRCQPPPRALMSRTAAVIRRVRMSTLERRAPSSIFCAKMTS
jgi:hypothetical protein